ncbi:MAG TPA: tetratricopeptide repeat protein, partial [Gammaproteobacteria bacterium]
MFLLAPSPVGADLDLSSLVRDPGSRESSRDEQLAHAGDPEAQFRLGQRYDAGKGVPRDYAEAFRWYRLAAAQGHVEAQLNVGLMYNEGQGVARDPAAGSDWLRRAADAGNATAQYSLGL